MRKTLDDLSAPFSSLYGQNLLPGLCSTSRCTIGTLLGAASLGRGMGCINTTIYYSLKLIVRKTRDWAHSNGHVLIERVYAHKATCGDVEVLLGEAPLKRSFSALMPSGKSTSVLRLAGEV